MYGIADLDNCYVSCERVFRPDLMGVPCVVLSNNDGCVVARSNEAKAMGIKEGTPFFQLVRQFGLQPAPVATRQSSWTNQAAKPSANMFDLALAAPSGPHRKMAVFSSNYELYGELTGRVVSIISKEAPAYFRYSIDECFMYLPSSPKFLDEPSGKAERGDYRGLNGETLKDYSAFLQQWGENLHKRIKREVGMPISIGLAPTKTLAKIASKLAKKYDVYKHCCMIDTDYKREKALEWCPIEDVWGIGRRYAAKLQALGCRTALDFAKHHKDWVRLTFNNINIVRTWQELNGEDAVPNEALELCSLATSGTQELAKKKSICTSRSFNGMISNIDDLRTHVSNYAARCAEKLRLQNTVATIVGVFLNTNMFREDLAQYWNFQEARLLTPSNSSITIIKAANDILQRIYRPGYQYKKAGVIVMGIGPDSPIQQDFFDINAEQFQKMRRLDEAVDRINRLHGSETIVLGSQQYTKMDGKGKADVFANVIKQDHKSPCYTTRWSEIIHIQA